MIEYLFHFFFVLIDLADYRRSWNSSTWAFCMTGQHLTWVIYTKIPISGRLYDYPKVVFQDHFLTVSIVYFY